MRFVLFVHSLLSDWNHGNAHFLRGITAELLARGHDVRAFEPAGGWSKANLLDGHGQAAWDDIASAFPGLSSTEYDLDSLDLDAALDGADVVIVHEWNDPALVARLGQRRAAGGRFRLLFHDTHHRSVTAPAEMSRYDLSAYDGVLAFGEAVRQRYLREGWANRAWTWHEAADTRHFRPMPEMAKTGDLVWVGNWGDDERTAELHEYLLGPVKALGLSADVHGVRYPDEGRLALAASGIKYRGWLPNHRAPEVFARYRLTVHVPRRPYVEALPGIPTIRVFEALACGIPLVSAPWQDAEGLFRVGKDLRMVRSGKEMTAALKELLNDPAAAAEQARCGLETIRSRHTCAHRVDELLAVCAELAAPGSFLALAEVQ
ncbi:glycosyltransferase [Aerophototrophica crusticola]|uniref:Glycosyltransferase n=1 Tax=Aerophototrophica crusticola TaxID=1709002 RepID=A0A858R7E8_9PROT|nr:glycosyltransferase [Rhodospirillaceae bacterium B3]